MFKKFTAIAFTGAMVFGFSAEPATTSAQDVQKSAAIHLQNGQLYLNGELIHKGFSVMQTRFAYLYFYVPERGLFTISNHEFEGAMQLGTFDQRKLSFTVNGLDLELKSSSQILADDASPAWVKFDPNFKLDVKTVMLGYGDKEKAPYEWPDQIRKNQQ
jgi:hypothetical protein